jgi:hypothetical protein
MWIHCGLLLLLFVSSCSLSNYNDQTNTPGIFQHNFCESRLQNNQPPEIYNAYTSLVISAVPFTFGFPKYQPFTNVAYALAINGFGSFYYHYYLTWLGKQADEISMILANYFGLCGLIQLYYPKGKRRKYHFWNMFYMYGFFVINSVMRFDVLFPYLFAIYLMPTLYYIRKIALIHKMNYIRYLSFSFVGASCWIISEINCNHSTVFGHVIWHFCFPLGFYKILLNYDELYQKIQNYDVVSNENHNI